MMLTLRLVTMFVVALTASSVLAQQVYSAKDDGVTPPRLVKSVKPAYTKQAEDARLQGVVKMSAVVRADGTAGDIVVTQSLDSSLNGLDEQAIIALQKWEFEPGTKDGKTVAVRINVELEFNLR